ncbi:MAG: hypothetical protein JWO46_2688, partial [Nocardioidaceae bacterium]|nr:hypothetical protein [Nocardioidaceae bacterium]
MDIVRYSRSGGIGDIEVDGYLNFHYLTHLDGAKKLLLESGINRTAILEAADGARRPAILLRTSAWKAGHETNPWEDVYDLDHGHVRYYGDHKPSTIGDVGVTPGNRSLLDAWRLHTSPIASERAAAPPLLLFRAVPVTVHGRRVNKGHLEFCGIGIIE